ncbi:MAG: uroporphyrinogen-III C-methyltransferase, partial [Candidatus Omnitrophica bacterium]|nr:uroporphyrinogen-III C-methyltransferase [Candidatus Omnitrophota bacterium]
MKKSEQLTPSPFPPKYVADPPRSLAESSPPFRQRRIRPSADSPYGRIRLRRKRGRGRGEGVGFVSLVGAGPGDPKLLTLRGKEVLEQADVVIYDYLVHPSLLRLAPQAKHIYVGKKGGDPDSTRQDSIDQLLVRLACEGKRVVRLKGGDPFVFGRGGEEAMALAKNKIRFEVVPGISAGIAAPAYAGIPVTHRGYASKVTFLTAHEDPRKKREHVDWKAIAGLSGTLVIFMGIKTLPNIIKRLLHYGKDRRTPVSVIRWGTTAQQRVVTGTLANIVNKVKQVALKPPAITVIGQVNRLRPLLNWFEKKPLFGKTVLVTRSRKQASQLSDRLESLGANVVEVPTIDISPINNFRILDEAIHQMATPHANPLPSRGEGRVRGIYDWIVFTSENGVEIFFNRLRDLRKDARVLKNVRIAAIGPGTQAKLQSFFVEPDLLPNVFTTEGLVKAFKTCGISGKKILLLRTTIAPKLLHDSLKKLGAFVTEIPVYKTKKPKGLQ